MSYIVITESQREELTWGELMDKYSLRDLLLFILDYSNELRDCTDEDRKGELMHLTSRAVRKIGEKLKIDLNATKSDGG